MVVRTPTYDKLQLRTRPCVPDQHSIDFRTFERARMWLLNASTRRLEYFINGDELRGKYAILSHTWDNEEVTFDEIHSPEARQKAGYRKIEYSCIQILKDRLTHVWVDTCKFKRACSN
jgi:hypothetical protein